MDVLIVHSLTLLATLAEEGPEPKDVKAGWTAFAIWIGLGLAVVFLAFSMTKRLRNAQASKDAGRYGDEPVSTDPVEPSTDGPVEDEPRA